MLDFDKKEKLESRLKYLEKSIKNFNKLQVLDVGVGALTFYAGKYFDNSVLEFVSYFLLGIGSLRAISYPFACKEYNLIKEDLEDKTDYDNQIS